LPLPYAYFVSSDDEFEVYFAIESNVFQEDLSLAIEYSFEWASLYKSEENEDVIHDNPFTTVISATPLYIDITGNATSQFFYSTSTS
jgi:hypothetical protein